MEIRRRVPLLTLFACLVSPVCLGVALGQAQTNKQDVPTVAREALKAVVLIVVSDATGREIKQGSGVVVSRDGKIITNYHVIEGGSSAVVKFQNGAFYLIDGVLGADKKKDIAVLKAAGADFPAIPLGESDKVVVGEEVVSVGSPLSLEATVSTGIISSIRDFEGEKMLQTTAPISPGSSGGALLNMSGEVIGITTSQLTGGQNLNFAIAIDTAKQLLMAQEIKKMRDIRPEQAGAAAEETGSQGGPLAKVPDVWTSLSSGHDFKLKIDGSHIYLDQVLPPAFQKVVEQGAFVRCDLDRQGQEWDGTCTSYLPYRWVSKWTGVHVNWCRLQQKDKITLLTATRIEGEAETFNQDDFDAGKCSIRKSKTMSFTWIPKD